MRVTPAVAILEKKFSAVVLVKPMVKSCMITPPRMGWDLLEGRTLFFLLAMRMPCS
jgi:hypothetical protein